MLRGGKTSRSYDDSGVTIFMLVAGVSVLLGFSALAVDMGAYYLARSEAQRAADAAALAGAGAFVTTSCTGSSGNACGSSTVETAATNEAITVGNQNLVGGQSPALVAGDVTFNVSNASNPQITVNVQRTTAHGNAMPTYFAKLFGFSSVDVSASATAEAFNASGALTSPPVGVSCVKPWILPNCDANHTSPANPNCPGSAYFIDPTTYALANPGPVSQGGIIGEAVMMKPGDPSLAAAPSQYYAAQVCVDSVSQLLCPNCAYPKNQGLSAGCTGATPYQENIECCNNQSFLCNGTIAIDLNLKTGNMQGPTINGVTCLIHESTSGTGQDTLCGTSVLTAGTNASCAPNFTIYGGSNNPNAALSGHQITASDSIINVPVYDGHMLCPGGSCGGTVTVMGFVQVFVNYVEQSNNAAYPKGTVYGNIMNIAGCGISSGSAGAGGGGGSGSSGTVSAGGVSMIPVRLVTGS